MSSLPRIGLDVHTHLIPVDSAELARLEGVAWNEESQSMVVDGHTIGTGKLFRPELLLEWMDRHGIERALVSIPPPAYRQHLPADQSLLWTSYVNRGLHALQIRTGGRLCALAHLPLEHPDVAIKVLQRQLGADVRHFAAAAGGLAMPGYAAPERAPMWRLLDEHRCFLFLHPGACADGRLAAHYLENLLGNPYETAVAACQLLMGGVLNQFPHIRFCLAHGGGALSAVAGRLQRGFDTARPGIDRAAAAPRETLRRFLADCIVHDAAALEHVAHVFGEEHVLFGSDWPFPMGIEQPARQLATVRAELLAGMCCRNHLSVFPSDS